MYQLPQALRALRNKKGLTQEQVAHYLYINRSTYTYYETGKTTPSFGKHGFAHAVHILNQHMPLGNIRPVERQCGFSDRPVK